MTSIRTICEVLNVDNGKKKLLSEVHKLIRLFLTVPISFATSYRTFSALKRVKTYLPNNIKLVSCLQVHVYKKITDQLDLGAMAQNFVLADDSRKNILNVSRLKVFYCSL